MAQRERDIDVKRLTRVVGEIVEETGGMEERGEASKQHVDGDLGRFGIAVMLEDGTVVDGGDADRRFPIQSISKVFSLALALDAFGETVWKRVGREPSGDPFNSIIDLERHEGKPRNPFINSGALVVVDMLLDRRDEGGEGPMSVKDFLIALTGDEDVAPNRDMIAGDRSSGFTNRALANLAKSFDNLNHPVDDVMEEYVAQCAVELSCRQLAKAGRFLALEGVDPETEAGERLLRRARRINALMTTCGQYDGSGDFAYRVGMPAKSGVDGGILAVVPNTASVAVWSPGLDENGNSLVGTRALAMLSERMDWSIFGSRNA